MNRMNQNEEDEEENASERRCLSMLSGSPFVHFLVAHLPILDFFFGNTGNVVHHCALLAMRNGAQQLPPTHHRGQSQARDQRPPDTTNHRRGSAGMDVCSRLQPGLYGRVGRQGRK